MQNDNEILNELRIEVAKQKENIDSLKTSVNKLEKQLGDFIALVKNGYIDDRVIKVLKQSVAYGLMQVTDIAEKEEIDSDYVEILKRIRDENYSKLKNKGGSKLIDKE